jgi:hypothetical protein
MKISHSRDSTGVAQQENRKGSPTHQNPMSGCMWSGSKILRRLRRLSTAISSPTPETFASTLNHVSSSFLLKTQTMPCSYVANCRSLISVAKPLRNSISEVLMAFRAPIERKQDRSTAASFGPRKGRPLGL